MNKSYKSGRVVLKSMDPATEKVSNLTLAGVKADATDVEIQAVKDAFTPLLAIPAQSANLVLTYLYQ